MSASEGRAGAQIAGRYRLIERCRLGAAPETWRAEDASGAACTLFYYPDAALGEDGARRFLSEAPFVRGVEHARLFQLLDVGVDATGAIFGVSPPIEGRTIASRAESVGAMPYLEATTVVCDALQGLGALHDRDLVHAGITSAEVIVAPDASGVSRGRLLLGGLLGGLASRARRSVGTRRGPAYGSAQHMAPEQCRGEPATPESDVWSMGVVLYEALTGTLPFDGESPLEVIAAVIGQAPRPMDSRVPEALRKIAMEALSRRAADRPVDAGTMCLMLSAAVKTVRESQVDPLPLKPTGSKFTASGHERGRAEELPADDLDALISTVKAEASPATDFSLASETAPPGAPPVSDGFDLDFEPASPPASTPPLAATPGLHLPPPPTSVPALALDGLAIHGADGAGAQVAVLSVQSLSVQSLSVQSLNLPPPESPQSPLAAPPPPPPPPPISFLPPASAATPAYDPTAALAHFDVNPASPSKRPGAVSSSIPFVPRESQTHTAMSPDVVDRTKMTVAKRPRPINPYAAFLAVAAVTGGIAYAGWKLSGADTPRPNPYAESRHPRAAHADASSNLAPDPEPGEVPADPDAPRPESQTPAELGIQLTVPVPAELPTDAALQFVRHVTGPALSDVSTTRGFASCADNHVYLHPGGLDPSLRVANVPVRCDTADLALVADVDGDHAADIAAVDPRAEGIVVVGSRNLRVTKRISLPGVLALVAGFSRTERRRTEPAVVAYASPQGGRVSLVQVGLRSGHIGWQTLAGFVPATPRDYGLASGPDADRDGVPDLVVGLVRDGHRCVTLVSGATGALRWPSPRCFENASAQSLSLGPDVNGDQRADVTVANVADGRVRVLSGEDGRPLRAIGAAAPGDGAAFGLGALLVPDLAHDGFADVIVGRTQSDAASAEIYSANDAHRVSTRPLTTREPAALAAVRVQYLEGFAFEGARSLLAATSTAVVVLGAAARPDVSDANAAP